ncbi:MAG: TIGR00725 family protein [Candidatus Lokiarchaeota archaeon]|nr:TIGR00725 family protein [Candidatus Lokiarchaeota archaeon]
MGKLIVGIVGTSSASKHVIQVAEKLGRLIVDNGYRIISGGLTGVMEAVSRGGQKSENHTNGDIIGILPGLLKTDANKYVDIIIPTGFGYARNLIIVNTADVVIAVAGGSGTLSEIAFAWQFQKPIIALDFEPSQSLVEKIKLLSHSDFKKSKGWSSIIGGLCLDETRTDTIFSAENPEECISIIKTIFRNGLK